MAAFTEAVDPKIYTVGGSTWEKALLGRALGNRKNLRIHNTHASANGYFWLTKKPWCLRFDGVGDSVDINTIVAAGSPILSSKVGKVCAKFMMAGTSGVRTILSLADNASDTIYFKLWIGDDEKLRVELRNATAVQWAWIYPTALSIDRWYHVAVIQKADSNGIIVELDSARVGYLTTTTKVNRWFDFIGGVNQANIGMHEPNAGATDYFIGDIDFLKIFGGSQFNGFRELSLICDYAFDEGTGTTLTDLSTNADNGTVANAAWIVRQQASVTATLTQGNLIYPQTFELRNDRYDINKPLWLYSASAAPFMLSEDLR